MEETSEEGWEREIKVRINVSIVQLCADSYNFRTFPQKFQEWRLKIKRDKTKKTSKSDNLPAVESKPVKDPVSAPSEEHRPDSSPSDDPSIDSAPSEAPMATESSATSFQTQKSKELAVRGIEETLDRPTTPSKATTWPRLSKDNTDDQDDERRLAKEAKDKIFVSHIPDRVDPTENGIDHTGENLETIRMPVHVDGGTKQRSSTVTKSNAVGIEELKKRYPTTGMTRALLAAKMQRMRPPVSIKDSAQFVRMWEQKLLPELTQILDQHGVGSYSINVRKGKETGYRVIDVMTEGNAGKKVDSLFESKRDTIFPKDLSSRTHFEFRGGKRGPCASSYASSSQRSATHGIPGNPRRYSIPVMGDSVGSLSPEISDSSASLGPIIKISGSSYRLLNWHTFDDGRDGSNRNWNAALPPRLNVVHPSPDDLHRFAPDGTSHVNIGDTVAYSGAMYQTSRLSGTVGGGEGTAHARQVVTDWVLCEAKTIDIPNKVRQFDIMSGGGSYSFSPDITGIADPEPRERPAAMVYSTGRSSGDSYGLVCETLGFTRLDNGTVTRDYAIESTSCQQDEWYLRGMGILGDSGAGVIDMKSHKLLGQLWGRNMYDGDPEEPRLTYFTAMSDIYDDIQERFPWPGPYRCPRPTLPGEVAPSDQATSAASEPLGIIQEGVESFTTTPDGHWAHPTARSCAHSTMVRSGDGALVLKQWAIFPHAHTWPTVPAAN
jgi:hypothetical protein